MAPLTRIFLFLVPLFVLTSGRPQASLKVVSLPSIYQTSPILAHILGRRNIFPLNQTLSLKQTNLNVALENNPNISLASLPSNRTRRHSFLGFPQIQLPKLATGFAPVPTQKGPVFSSSMLRSVFNSLPVGPNGVAPAGNRLVQPSASTVAPKIPEPVSVPTPAPVQSSVPPPTPVPISAPAQAPIQAPTAALASIRARIAALDPSQANHLPLALQILRDISNLRLSQANSSFPQLVPNISASLTPNLVPALPATPEKPAVQAPGSTVAPEIPEPVPDPASAQAPVPAPALATVLAIAPTPPLSAPLPLPNLTQILPNITAFPLPLLILPSLPSSPLATLLSPIQSLQSNLQAYPLLAVFHQSLLNASTGILHPWAHFNTRLSVTASTLPDLFAAQGSLAGSVIAAPIHLSSNLLNSLTGLLNPANPVANL